MNISAFDRCADCGACYNICPTGAISVSENGLFYTPMVDAEKCIDCSACASVCPVNNDIDGNGPIRACAGWNKDASVVLKSSSGGVFYGLAEKVIAEGGAAFGAAFSQDYKSVRLCSTDEVPFEKLLKSKYVESMPQYSFTEVKAELEKGRKVLFCAAPCQCAGLSAFLGKDYDNLIICDFACGGVPSHKIFQDYLSELERRYKSTVKSVDFRPKTHGWKRYAVRTEFYNGREHLRLGSEDPYLKCFLRGKLSVRDYCHECKFPECHISDLTIADFWLNEKLSSLRSEDGISLVLCNTEKGKKALDEIARDYIFEELDLDAAGYNNRIRISERNIIRHEEFMKRYAEEGLEASCRAMLPSSVAEKLKNRIVRLMVRKRR
ncbi:Coenzyme F420 hydrogenase/dehydrogenase, beta subunit C-terminal domain [Ruminococcus sp.]|uniref:Coenzyme F420 hydrogenase/dehydrogenase, beta subunit C-terminal domain n=1 Tax=Ruminococcus sp. TaxID=41978 RepID=UPI0025D223F5|nr:Coenzyme F420 hydrogenase/dehydrogenase, beta subunit C-terminal domain [Ruminococcus sp.]MBR1431509.1 Coenzyme F420 hydrogenase/dehydrogenase, beta subunit C-terminal domain [Ruminococcus sp.]